MRDWEKKQKEYEERMARVKNAKLRLTCSICSAKAKLPCPCGTAQYCSVACQKVDWRERGHRTACKKIRDERAAEAARAEAPTPPPEVFYGPAPRSHADEVRARIAAEHEAARARREANPEPEPESTRWGSRCPICLEKWDVNEYIHVQCCCSMRLCLSCNSKVKEKSCPLCQAPAVLSWKDELAWIRRHVENDVPEQVARLGEVYSEGALGVVKSDKKAAKIFKRGVELGSVNAMVNLSCMYLYGNGVKPDKKKAMQLGRMAADRGSADAQRNIGHQLIIEGNFEEGFPYLRRAAEQGHTQAEVTLGVFCATREFEIDKDTMKRYGLSDEEAKHWLLRAAAKGNEEAKAHLAELDA